MIKLIEPGNIEGLSYSMVSQLRKAGYHTLLSVNNASAKELSQYMGIPLFEAKEIKRICINE